MKLITMTDFVFLLRNKTTYELCRDYPNSFRMPEWNGDQSEMVKKMLAIDAIQWKLVGEYAKFLKQPLKLEMFVPCDENGNVLEQPIDIYYRPDFGCQKYPQECYEEDLKKYEQALEKVLFESFEFEDKFHWGFEVKTKEELGFIHIEFSNEYIVEDLILKYGSNDFILTPNAIKQIGL